MFGPWKMTRWLTCLLLLTMIGLVGSGGCQRYEVPTADVRGTVTINGKPVQGVTVKFVPKSKRRYSIAETDASGRYSMAYTSSQSGVPLGPCVVEFSVYRGESMHNYLPKEFNEKAADNPAYHVDVPAQGLTFDHDIKFTGEIPPYKP